VFASCRYDAWKYTRLDSSGQFIRHNVPMGDIAVHFRGGSIIPMQPYANLTKIVRYTPVTLVVTLPAHPSGTPGAPLPPYATEEACAAVHAAHPGQLVSCGVLFMDTPDDTDVTPGNSVEVRDGLVLVVVLHSHVVVSNTVFDDLRGVVRCSYSAVVSCSL
jgi:hypothetical protein